MPALLDRTTLDDSGIIHCPDDFSAEDVATAAAFSEMFWEGYMRGKFPKQGKIQNTQVSPDRNSATCTTDMVIVAECASEFIHGPDMVGPVLDLADALLRRDEQSQEFLADISRIKFIKPITTNLRLTATRTVPQRQEGTSIYAELTTNIGGKIYVVGAPTDNRILQIMPSNRFIPDGVMSLSKHHSTGVLSAEFGHLFGVGINSAVAAILIEKLRGKTNLQAATIANLATEMMRQSIDGILGGQAELALVTGIEMRIKPMNLESFYGQFPRTALSVNLSETKTTRLGLTVYKGRFEIEGTKGLIHMAIATTVDLAEQWDATLLRSPG